MDVIAEKYSDLLLIKFVLDTLGKGICNDFLDMLERGEDLNAVTGFLRSHTTDFEGQFAKYVEIELNEVKQ